MATYELINTTTLSTTTTSFTISSIPTTYTDLYVWFNPFIASGDYFDWRLNGSSSSIYTYKILRNDSGSGDSYGSTTNGAQFYSQSLSSNVPQNGGTSKIYIGQYANTSYNKAALYDGGAPTYTAATAYKQILATGNFASNSAVTSITLINASNFDAGTTVSIYGIKNS